MRPACPACLEDVILDGQQRQQRAQRGFIGHHSVLLAGAGGRIVGRVVHLRHAGRGMRDLSANSSHARSLIGVCTPPLGYRAASIAAASIAAARTAAERNSLRPTRKREGPPPRLELLVPRAGGEHELALKPGAERPHHVGQEGPRQQHRMPAPLACSAKWRRRRRQRAAFSLNPSKAGAAAPCCQPRCNRWQQWT